MDNNTALLFSHFGMGHGPAQLQQVLADKFLRLSLENRTIPGKILFITDGVRLACSGSQVLEVLRDCEAEGAELVLCSTCLETLGLLERVEVGIVGGMGDILEALTRAGKVITL